MPTPLVLHFIVLHIQFALLHRQTQPQLVDLRVKLTLGPPKLHLLQYAVRVDASARPELRPALRAQCLDLATEIQIFVSLIGNRRHDYHRRYQHDA